MLRIRREMKRKTYISTPKSLSGYMTLLRFSDLDVEVVQAATSKQKVRIKVRPKPTFKISNKQHQDLCDLFMCGLKWWALNRSYIHG